MGYAWRLANGERRAETTKEQGLEVRRRRGVGAVLAIDWVALPMSHRCPVCGKVSSIAMDLARHVIGQEDRVHRDGNDIKGWRFSELLTMQFRSFGGEG